MSLPTLSPSHHAFHAELATLLPADRLITDPTLTLAYGTDASFYRLTPQVVVQVETEAEVRHVLHLAHRHRVAVTFRAAGTSLSGQAVSDSVLVMLGRGWQGQTVLEDGARIRLQPGVIGQQANATLAPWGRKIGPDPASIATAKIGGMAANNASGMCCGTAQNSYHTLSTLRVMLADGTVLDTADAASVAAFRHSHADLLVGLTALAQRIHTAPALADKIRHKYRLKNTTGYGINALLDFSDPIAMLTHLMIGSEGTLGFIASITFDTVPDHPHKASCLVLFDDLDRCCRAVTALKAGAPVAAVELLDSRSLRAVQHKAGLPAFLAREVSDTAAALLIETRAANATDLAAHITQIEACLAAYPAAAYSGFSPDAATSDSYWAVRKGLFPAVGAVRPVGTTVVIEDVAFPVEQLAEGVRRLTALFDRYAYTEALIFGHALEGNVHFVFTPSFDTAEEITRYQNFMDDVSLLVAVEFGGSLKAEHGTGRNVAPFVALEWGEEAYGIMRDIKRLFDPHGVLNPDVIITDNPHLHLAHLKAMPAADPLIDRCIECGFCEPACPATGLSLSPRQRIVLWRQIQHLRRSPHQHTAEDLAHHESRYRYLGIDTCAATGMCATRCPVGINTGSLMQQLKGATAHPAAARWAAGHLATLTAGARLGLGLRAGAERLVGKPAVAALNRGAHRLVKTIPLVPSGTPAPARPLPLPVENGGDPVVYFVSCVNRTLAEARDGGDSLAVHTLSLFAKAGFAARYPDALASLCCGQPFAAKNAAEAEVLARRQTEQALLRASENGRFPVYVDNSPCAERLLTAQRAGQLDARLRLMDAATFLLTQLAPRLTLTRRWPVLAVHVPCSAHKMGAGAALVALARQCAETVIVPDIACCGFAGDKGFTLPELNAHALQPLAAALPAGCAGVSMSRTCQIGLTTHSGVTYQSLEAVLDGCSERG